MSYTSVIAGLPNVKAYWTFDETSGTTAADSIGTHTGTLTGTLTQNVTSVAGITPGFSGTASGFVSLATSADFLPNSGDFWFVGWFKTSHTGTTVLFGNTGQFLMISAGKISLGGTAQTTAAYNDNAWHLVIMTRVSATLNFYMDGATTPTSTASYPSSIDFGNGNPAGIMGMGNNSYLFNGAMDGVAWGNGSGLTGTHSAAIYAAGLNVSIAISPTSITQGTTGNAITITGTGTAWTAGTPGSPTFTLSGGTGASITAQTVASGTSATITVTAGSAAGTLTITDPSTSATASLTVNAATATAFTLTGPSSGTVNTASTNFTFTPNGNYSGTITPTMSTLSGSWSPTSLTWSGTATAKTATFTPTTTGTGNANGTASPSLTQPANVSYASSFAALVAGSLALVSSSPAGPKITVSNATAGTPTVTNRLHRGAIPTFTASGTTAGSGTCIAVNPSSPYIDSTAAAGTSYWYRLISTDAVPTTVSSADIGGSVWSGAISLGGVGDSIMAGNNPIGTCALALQKSGNTRLVTSTNAGVSSSLTATWTPGTANYNSALSAFNAASPPVTHIVINLGINDTGQPPSTYHTNLQSIITGFFTDIPTLVKIYISYNTQWISNGSKCTELLTFQTEMESIANADPSRVKVIGRRIYEWFADRPSEMSVDGIHPTPTGSASMAEIWAQDIAADLAGSSGTTTVVSARTDYNGGFGS